MMAGSNERMGDFCINFKSASVIPGQIDFNFSAVAGLSCA